VDPHAQAALPPGCSGADLGPDAFERCVAGNYAVTYARPDQLRLTQTPDPLRPVRRGQDVAVSFRLENVSNAPLGVRIAMSDRMRDLIPSLEDVFDPSCRHGSLDDVLDHAGDRRRRTEPRSLEFASMESAIVELAPGGNLHWTVRISPMRREEFVDRAALARHPAMSGTPCTQRDVPMPPGTYPVMLPVHVGGLPMPLVHIVEVG
jgi:hypothetical protein